jgi:uncharacterized protein YbjT (DUF2867 family)
MIKRISVAGATGNLGTRITRSLIDQGADVVAIAREGTKSDKLTALQQLGATVATIDMTDATAVAKALDGTSCVVSALQGLRDVIVDAQSILLNAAITAGVGRFIPSDFSTDFTKLPAGRNRNFDLRREFHKRLNAAPIAATAIFNGAFGEILTYNVPILDFKNQIVGYWEDPDWRLDFTTMDDTAAYTAAAALDATTPKALRIASFQVTPRELQRFTEKTLKTPFTLKCLGSRDELAAYNERERAAHPEGELEIFPSWQQSQYIESMFSTQHESLDNGRYPELKWTSLGEVVPTRS